MKNTFVPRQEDFWSKNPCDIDGNYKEISFFRYSKEPYLPIHFRNFKVFIKDNAKILEVGCGQGTDALSICSLLTKQNNYVGIDYSKASIQAAEKNKQNCLKEELFKCKLDFQEGDALNLNAESNSIDFVYSMGVLHHTPNMKVAISEIYRVLKKGGHASIYLYRTRSLKVEIAKFLRKVQQIVDNLLNKKRYFYTLLKNRKSKIFGTMFLECFGVPVFDSVSKKEIKLLFSKFSELKFNSCGNNFYFMNKFNNGINNRFGVYYKIDLIK